MGIRTTNGQTRNLNMSQELDEEFFNRADAHIKLSNEQLRNINAGKVSASMMYATARFNAWLSACGFHSGEEMSDARDATVDYFVEQYRSMLKENLDDYIKNFGNYMLDVNASTN